MKDDGDHGGGNVFHIGYFGDFSSWRMLWERCGPGCGTLSLPTSKAVSEAFGPLPTSRISKASTRPSGRASRASRGGLHHGTRI